MFREGCFRERQKGINGRFVNRPYDLPHHTIKALREKRKTTDVFVVYFKKMRKTKNHPLGRTGLCAPFCGYWLNQTGNVAVIAMPKTASVGQGFHALPFLGGYCCSSVLQIKKENRLAIFLRNFCEAKISLALVAQISLRRKA